MNLVSAIFGNSITAHPTAPQEKTTKKTESLEEVLLDLAKWGQPRVGIYGSDGLWHCSVDVNVTPVGVKFEAKSSFKCKTPTDAALECRQNLQDAIKTIGGAA